MASDGGRSPISSKRCFSHNSDATRGGEGLDAVRVRKRGVPFWGFAHETWGSMELYADTFLVLVVGFTVLQ